MKGGLGWAVGKPQSSSTATEGCATSRTSNGGLTAAGPCSRGGGLIDRMGLRAHEERPPAIQMRRGRCNADADTISIPRPEWRGSLEGK